MLKVQALALLGDDFAWLQFVYGSLRVDLQEVKSRFKSSRDTGNLLLVDSQEVKLRFKSSRDTRNLLLLDLLEVKSRFKRRSPDTGNLDYNS